MTAKRESRSNQPARHIPVLAHEVIDYLDLQPGLTVVDGTVGAAGHSRRILEAIGRDGLLIGLDRDPMMLSLARTNLAAPNVHLHHASYSELATVLQHEGIDRVDRILLDLGLSSDQLAESSRGFGFQAEGPLDLRFDPEQGEPASSLLARLDEDELERIFREYGEERFSAAIARELVQRRGTVQTTSDLVEAVRAAIPEKFLRSARKHPATRVFQALRIAVNDELTHLETALNQTFPQSLVPGGRLVVISFHSLEDRLVKQAFRGKEQWQNLTPKPITAGPNEQRINPRSRTAKLRAARKR